MIRSFACGFTALSIASTAGGCTAGRTEPTGGGGAPRPSSRAAEPARFGSAIEPGREARLTAVLDAPATFSDAPVIVEGTVRRACTRRGCWMELAERADEDAPGCRVTFKDYGFFVPTSSAGAAARVQGVVVTKTLDREQVAHMESEGARFARKRPDGTADEVRLVATGVELRRL